MDEELDPAPRAEVQEHLAWCPACSEVFKRLQQQRAEIRAIAFSDAAPATLDQAVRAALRREAGKQAKRYDGAPWRLLAIAASVLLCVSLAWDVARLRPTGDEPLARDLLASHVRSLMGGHLVDVSSSDQHTVKPWFNGKLDFSPEVKDLALGGFPLAGGRLEYVDGRPVAALVYGRRQHMINLFTWPTGTSRHGRDFSRQGYNFLHWTDAGMTYWAISDITVAELEQFREAYQK